MSDWPEEGVVFPCRGMDLVGIVHRGASRRGVLVVVGGPQYRAGSHRQFTLLARRLAAQGIPVFRFDCRGHGDSDGCRPGFEHTAEDIDAALTEFTRCCDGVKEVVILGLCDAASAALLHGCLPPTVVGLVLLNPWVTEAQVAAETMLKHYYLRRLVSRSFWRKLLVGRVSSGTSLRELGTSLESAVRRRLQAAGPATEITDSSLSGRMAAGLAAFPGRVLLITSGNDLTAGEFLDTAKRDRTWKGLLLDPRVTHHHIADANHTFASQSWRSQVEDSTLEWMTQW